VSITLDLAPNLFIQRGFSFGSIQGRALSTEEREIWAEASKISGEEQVDVSAVAELLGRLDRKLEDLEEQRAALLYLRNKAMESASRALEKVDGRAKRRVIFSILDEHDMDVRRLSEDLDLRESVIREILKEMRDILE
ncbi:MAG: hypothetical protein JRN44_04025, partial [Nitrososphaerota archaeon]|nr:hypothetical protein [Nitrososphaerota archaeon]